MISTIHLEYTADMTHMKVTGIDNETVFKHTFYDPVNKVKTNIVFDGTVALCEKVSDYESDMTKCENTSTTCVKKFTQESVLTHSDISTFIAWVREYNIQHEYLYDQGLVSGLRFTYKYTESGESSTPVSIVDLGTFNDETELITHVIMNQLPSGHYTFIMGVVPVFALIERGPDRYYGAFHDSTAIFYYFEVSFTGEILALKEIDLRDLDGIRAYVDSQDLLLMDYVDEQDALKADKTYVDSKVQTDVPSGAKFTDTVTTISGKTGTISKADITALGIPAQDTVYSHPNSHPASIITESTTKRFVSDAEKTLWNSKSEFSGNYNDLSNKPTIPSNTSQLTNNSGYITINDIPDVPPSIQVGGVKPTDGSMWYEVI